MYEDARAGDEPLDVDLRLVNVTAREMQPVGARECVHAFSLASYGDHRVASLEQGRDELPANEAGCPGHDNLHGSTDSEGTAMANWQPHDRT